MKNQTNTSIPSSLFDLGNVELSFHIGYLIHEILYCTFSFTHSLHLELYSYFSIPSLSYLVDPLVLIIIKENMVLISLLTWLLFWTTHFMLPQSTSTTYPTCYLLTIPKMYTRKCPTLNPSIQTIPWVGMLRCRLRAPYPWSAKEYISRIKRLLDEP